MTKDEILEKALMILNKASSLDPNAMDSLNRSRVPCNFSLAEDFLVDTCFFADDCHTDKVKQSGIRKYYRVGFLGVLNGIIEELTGKRIAASYLRRRLDGMEYFLGYKIVEVEKEERE